MAVALTPFFLPQSHLDLPQSTRDTKLHPSKALAYRPQFPPQHRAPMPAPSRPSCPSHTPPNATPSYLHPPHPAIAHPPAPDHIRRLPIGATLWLRGQQTDCLLLASLSYMLVFDALGSEHALLFDPRPDDGLDRLRDALCTKDGGSTAIRFPLRIPYYNAWDATKALKVNLGKHYSSSDKNYWYSLWKCFRQCCTEVMLESSLMFWLPAKSTLQMISFPQPPKLTAGRPLFCPLGPCNSAIAFFAWVPFQLGCLFHPRGASVPPEDTSSSNLHGRQLFQFTWHRPSHPLSLPRLDPSALVQPAATIIPNSTGPTTRSPHHAPLPRRSIKYAGMAAPPMDHNGMSGISMEPMSRPKPEHSGMGMMMNTVFVPGTPTVPLWFDG
ncbi:hypothetical protein PtA15_8A103 [Puccinia triticina]|uniref:Uncharacterized protein n=1 Tax=Puccinia triticina TaxID=208348 RepID=A0ABY7CRV0_9BASI|nr:uncharacterized protein PtA15_8A103 [Puccinia triticina]WAQ87202.1 hypothetical protein PtA15_8A103 [Puccinia triticina]